MDGPSAAELFERQAALQAEARGVEADLDVDGLFGPIGEVVRVGSSALGLMVWRDIDLTVVCGRLALEAVLDVGKQVAAHPRVRRVEFRNDAGAWNMDLGYPDGLYLGIGYRAPTGEDWKLDVWFVDEPDRQPDLAHVRSMPGQLTPETREAILRIKGAWASRPEYGSSVRSFDIYTAVLKDGVRSTEDFERWLQDAAERKGRTTSAT